MSANSTVMFSGFNPNSRNSSKVLAPPGGGSSGIFGPPIEEEKPQRRASQTTNILDTNEKENEKTKDALVEGQDKVKKHGLASTFQLGQQAEEKTVNEKKSVDPLTGAVLGERASPFNPASPNVAAAPKSKTRMPPGGHTTPFW